MAEGALAAYRLVSMAATPLVQCHLKQRLARGREDAARRGERLGRAGIARPEGPLAWIHGASVGEVLSALPLMERIAAERPEITQLVTSGTPTSARLNVTPGWS